MSVLRTGVSAPAAAFLAFFAVFWAGALDVPFQFDDEGLIETNARLARPVSIFAALHEAVTAPFGRAATTLSLQIDHALWGTDPRGYHLTALLLHLAVSALVGLLAARACAALGFAGAVRAAGWIAAAAFAFHPLQVETVAYLSARSTLLCALASLLAVLAADAAARARGAGRPDWTRAAWGAAGASFLAVAAMPGGLAAPALALAWVVAVRGAGRRTLAAGAALALVPFLLVAPDLAHFLRLREGVRAPGYAAAYWFTQPECLLRAAGQIALPREFSVDHDVMPVGVALARGETPAPPSEASGRPARFSPERLTERFDARAALADPRFWGPSAAILLATGAALAWGRRRGARDPVVRLAVACAGLFIVAWLPAALAPLEDLYFEHRFYLALAGPAVAVGAGAAALAGRLGVVGRGARAPRLAALGVAVLFVWGVTASDRLAVWGREDALWADAVRRAPAKARPRFNLATVWHDVGRPPPERLRQMCLAASASFVRFRDNVNLLAEIHNLMGGIHQWMGEEEVAHYCYRIAHWMIPDSSAFLSNLAACARALGRHEEAAASYGELLRRAPERTDLAVRLAEALAAAGRLDEARRLLEGILARDPAHHAAAVNLAAVLVQAGDAAGAIALCERTLARVRSAPLYHNLAAALLSAGRADEAREVLARAVRFDPGYGPVRAALRDLSGQ